MYVCMHAYTMQKHICQPHLLYVDKIKEILMLKNLFELVKKALNEIGGMDEFKNFQKVGVFKI